MKNNSPTPSVSLTAVAAWCTTSDCPTIYRTDRDTLVVQGYDFEPQTAGYTIPDGERMVEIPVDLLTRLINTSRETTA